MIKEEKIKGNNDDIIIAIMMIKKEKNKHLTNFLLFSNKIRTYQI
jgi:hypothetical protein